MSKVNNYSEALIDLGQELKLNETFLKNRDWKTCKMLQFT